MEKYLSHNGNLLKRGANKFIYRNYTPGTVLPPYTLRLKFKDGITPTFSYGTGTLFDASNNIWDLTYENSNWRALLLNQTDLLEVIEGNTTNVTNMRNMFGGCSSLTNVSLFDTSSVTDMYNMFITCTSLTSIPLFNTSSVTNMNSMFFMCYKVESGALSLYLQASTQSIPPSSHSQTFTSCGSNTSTGRAELAQIPSDWGGKM